MEFGLRPLGFMDFLQNNNHHVVNKIYLLLLYNSSILDIEHSPYYIALGSPQTYKVI